MMKRAMFLILAGMLCASVALAGPPNSQDTFTLNGKIAGADIYNADFTLEGGGTGYVDLWLQPALLDDGSWGYYAQIDWEDGFSGGEIYGQVSASVVTPYEGLWGPVQVNFTPTSFINPYGYHYTNFSSLTGTFTVYRGPGSQHSANNGRTIYTEKTLDGTIQIGYSFKGTWNDQSAAFVGTFGTTNGSFDVSVEGASNAADLFVQVGTMTVGPEY